MVLPPPAAHDAIPPREADWIERIRVALRLAKAGILVRVDHAVPERLGDLVRGIIGDHPDIDVHADLGALEDAPEGSALVLVASPDHAEALNLGRPLFSRRKLKVVLWCDHATSVALAEKAPDFFDWISDHVDCPPGPVPHAVAGFRRAVEAGAPGIVWRGSGGEEEKGRVSAALAAAFPGHQIDVWIDPTDPFSSLVDAIRDTKDRWFGGVVEAHAHVRRLRWAMAEAGRRGRAVIVSVDQPCPGFWPVHGRLMPFEEARQELDSVGSRRPGALAALTGLEPEAVELARSLLGGGATDEQLRGWLSGGDDPGALLARAASSRGSAKIDDVVRWAAPPPFLRALAMEKREETRALVRDVERRLAGGESPAVEDVGRWAALREDEESPSLLGIDGMAQEFLIEAFIRGGTPPGSRARLAGMALAMGEHGAAYAWTMSAAMSPWNIGRHREIQRVASEMQSLGLLSDARHVDEALRRARRTFIELLFALPIFVLPFATGLSGSLTLLMPWAVVVVVGCVVLFFVIARAPDPAGPESQIEPIVELAGRGKLDRALERCEELLGYNSDRPLHRAALRLEGHVLVEKREDRRAEAVLREAITLEGRIVGVEHSYFVATLLDLAAVLTPTGRARDAETFLLKLLGPREELPHAEDGAAPEPPSFGPQRLYATGGYLQRFLALSAPPSITPDQRARARRLLAEAWISQGRHDEAEQLLDRAAARAQQDLGPTHEERRRTLLAHGRALLLVGRADQAELVLRRALALAEQYAGERHPDTGSILGQLALAEARLGRREQAAEHARRALAVLAEAQIAETEKELVRGDLTPLTALR